MRMEPMAFDLGTCLHSEKELLKDGDSGVISSVEDHVASKPPAKKQTRQWAAWTRQEEESFFTALRQVGKNFEKITCRVQSKNKDQVRHYYYRLVRRMNKLLGPELSLDAKNSKDTNAAMLRWWSLLEKYSCKASKLHLKPRRFKIFIENLENQLMKDRKRKIRKRHSQGGNCSTTPSQSVLNQGAVKPVLLDSQKLQKLASGKGSVVRRNANTGTNRNSSKGDSSSVKAARQRRRSGTASTAAYKKWEKAAIAGVSLVADAAAHLEQATKDKLADLVQDSQREKGFDPVAKEIPPLPTFQQTMFTENVIQTSMKLKLQLFPIDEGTRRALEMDNHNPHLELTLSMRKRISSVVEHLHRKWGSSRIAFGELMLLPYCAQRENLGSCHKWAQDSVLSAADVYALTGSPTVFRLRYGWFQVPLPSCEVLGEQTAYVNIMENHDAVPVTVPTVTAGHDTENPLASCKDQVLAEIISTMAGSPADFHNKVSECNSIETNKNVISSSELPPSFPWQSRDARTGAISKQLGCVDEKGSQRGARLSAVEWADSLTNISVGDLLSEVSHNADASYNDPHLPSGSHPLQQIPFSCDSFDAAIAAHLNKHQSKAVFQPTHSIWDAEETCDGFSFQKNSVFYKEAQRADQVASTSSAALGTNKEVLPVAEEPMDDDPAHGDPMDVCLPDRHPEENSAKDLSGLNDIYWPDSLGPLDLDVPSCRYQSNELIFSDSLSGLNRLVNSSLDAFQSCSFYGLDKKETTSTIEARETATFSDYKIGSEV